jgi:non-ribosomal peptide synthetase component E (peptide arylation enzyme)
LPEYMVPNSLTFFEEFPLNFNGKIDRRAITKALSAD